MKTKSLVMLLLFISMSGTAIFAADVVYDFSQEGYTNTQKLKTGLIDDVYNTVWTADQGTGTVAPAYYNEGNALRIYGGGTFTISSEKAIAEIVLYLDISSRSGNFEQDSIQHPNDFSFTFTRAAGSGHVRIQKIEITYVDYYMVIEALQVYEALALSSGSVSADPYTVRGYVTRWKSGYPNYQNGDFYIDDAADGSTSAFECFRLYGQTEEDKRTLNVGDYIEAKGYLMNYNGQPELVRRNNVGDFTVLRSAGGQETARYTLSVSAAAGGSVNTNVNGSYAESTTVVLTATPESGWRFTEWSDHNTDNPRTVTLTQNITLTAYFEEIIVCNYPELEGLRNNFILDKLHELIKDHTILSYNDARADQSGIDFRADGTIWDMYSDCSFYSGSYCGSGTSFPSCECYNREHALPKSWWGSSQTEPMYTDLHHIIPTDFVANSQRGAWAYGEVTGTPDWSNSLGSKLGETSTYSGGANKKVFEPADEYKGDIARIYFYMLTCYRDKNFTQGGQGYRMFSYGGSTADFTVSAQNLLLKWHRQDPVSQKEIDRNEAVASKQGNRNPFVDEPELVEYIWGDRRTEAYACPKINGVENIDSVEKISARKIIQDNHLYIQLADGTLYDVYGRKVK